MSKTNEKCNDSFVFFEGYYNALQCLSDAERLAMYDAICLYGLYEREQEGLQGKTRLLFDVFKSLHKSYETMEEEKMGNLIVLEMLQALSVVSQRLSNNDGMQKVLDALYDHESGETVDDFLDTASNESALAFLYVREAMNNARDDY